MQLYKHFFSTGLIPMTQQRMNSRVNAQSFFYLIYGLSWKVGKAFIIFKCFKLE